MRRCRASNPLHAFVQSGIHSTSPTPRHQKQVRRAHSVCVQAIFTISYGLRSMNSGLSQFIVSLDKLPLTNKRTSRTALSRGGPRLKRVGLAVLLSLTILIRDSQQGFIDNQNVNGSLFARSAPCTNVRRLTAQRVKVREKPWILRSKQSSPPHSYGVLPVCFSSATSAVILTAYLLIIYLNQCVGRRNHNTTWVLLMISRTCR